MSNKKVQHLTSTYVKVIEDQIEVFPHEDECFALNCESVEQDVLKK